MAETASETITIAAPPERVWEIAADVERYPDWARDVKDVVVRSRDEQQRPSEVEFRASALGRSTHYTLAYDYSQAPEVLAWKMVKGDIQRSIEGAYHFTPDRRRRHRGALRPGHRAGRAAARLRQAAGRGAHPQLGPRAEGPRRGVSGRVTGRPLGIDVGGTKCLGVVIDDDGAIVAETREPTPHGGDALIDVLAEIVAELEADGRPGRRASASACPG